MKKADQLLRVFRNIEVDEANMLLWQGVILPVYIVSQLLINLLQLVLIELIEFYTIIKFFPFV